MASIALGLVGAGLGSLFPAFSLLGMSASSLGWSVGSALGSALFGPGGQDIQGPRLSDKSVSTSAYGNVRPIVYGTYRVGGDVIWATDLKEHKHKEEAGKGGGGGSYTTYTYTVSFAVALCEGPINGVRKIWMDSKLVYSQADDATSAELQKSAKFAKRMTVYLGDTTQLPDPTIESELGAGNVPAYRGTAYLVFDDLDVTKYGSRIPQITVEVCRGTQSLAVSSINATYSGNINTFIEPGNGVFYITKGGGSQSDADLAFVTMGLDGTVKRYKKRAIGFTSGVLVSETAALGLDGQPPTYWGTFGITRSGTWLIADVGRNTGTARFPAVMLLNEGTYSYIGICAMQNDLLDAADATAWVNNIRAVENQSATNPLSVYVYHYTDGKLYRFDVYLGIFGYVMLEWPTWVDNVDSSWYDLNGDSAKWPGMCVDEVSGDIFCILHEKNSANTSIKRFTNDGDLVEEKFINVLVDPGNYSSTLSYSNGLIWVLDGGLGVDALKVYDWETEALLYSGDMSGLISASSDAVAMSAMGNIMVSNAYGTVTASKIAMTRVSMALDDVVSDLCTRTDGLEASDIDVTELASDNVRGFLVGSQMPARAAIQTLGAAYFFDGVESDGVLKFVKRGGAVAATLNDDDIGCYEGEPVELWQTTRTQEEELPQELTLRYAQFDADYQQGAQHSRREAVLSGNKAMVDMPLALTDDEAKSIVDTMMFTAWHHRHQFKTQTWQKYAKLEPTDIISANGETLYIAGRNEGVNGLIELECVRELPAIYTGQVGTGVSGSNGGQAVKVYGPTEYELLDIPNLRDEDYNANGIYWAASGILTDWAGSTLLKSTDNGLNWQSLQSTDLASVIGVATTALGDFYGGNIFDELNTVRVQVGSALSSSTWGEVLNGANVALIGDEIIQFRTATLISAGIYDLTGLLRGRRGTEWAMGSHVDSERFVLLDETKLRFISLQSTDFNVSRLFGAVSHGDTIEDVETEYLTYTGENLKPFAPVHPSATLGSDGSINLDWDQRSRYSAYWQSGRVPLEDEATSTFEVVIYDDSNFTTALSTNTGVTAPWAYTSAMQTTDYGNPVKTIHYKVRQEGASRDSEWAEFSGTVTDVGSMCLMHFDGAQDATTFTDVYGHSFSASGNTRLRTDAPKFGTASLYCPGTGDLIRTAYSTDFDPEYFDFTAECWLYLSGYRAGYGHICGTYEVDGSGNVSGWQLALDSTGHLVFRYGLGGSSITVATSSSTVATAAQKHVAVTRNGNTITLWIEGANVGSGTLTGDILKATSYYGLGCYSDSSAGGYLQANSVYGYIDEHRFSKGIDRYTGAFTPSSSAFTS